MDDVLKQAEEIAGQIQKEHGTPNDGDQFQLPEKLGEFETPKVNEAIKQQFGFGIDEAVQWKEKVAKVQELEQQLEQYKGVKDEYQGYIKPANELVANINSLYAKGESPERIKQYLSLQTLDPKSLSDDEAIFRREKMEYPDMTDQEIRDSIKFKYSVSAESDDDEPDPRLVNQKSIEKKKEAKAAREFLQNQVSDFTKNVLNPNDPVKQQEAKVRTQAFTRVAESVLDTVRTIDTGFKEGDFDYSFSYKVELTPEEKKGIAQAVAHETMKAGKPLNDYPFMHQMAKTMVALKQQQKVTESALRDLYAKMVESTVQRQAGPPAGKGSQHNGDKGAGGNAGDIQKLRAGGFV